MKGKKHHSFSDRWFWGKHIDGLYNRLNADETVTIETRATLELEGGRLLSLKSYATGWLAATNSRIVFFAKNIGGFEFAEFPYTKITSVDCSEGTSHGDVLSFFLGERRIEIIGVREHASEFAKLIREEMCGDPRPEVDDSIAHTLKQLADLRDQGILTAEEFETKKRELLDRM